MDTPADSPGATSTERSPTLMPPLLILAADESALCTDDLCLPAELRP